MRSPAQARDYIRSGPMAMRARHGFGLDAMVLRETGAPVGICGLLRRDTLDDVDIGFALLPAYSGLGLAREAARATLERAARDFGLRRVAAITVPANAASIRLLESLGFAFERMVRLGDDPKELRLYARALEPC